MTPYRDRKERGDFAPPSEGEGTNLGSMTKDELLAEAERRGVDATSAMTKADIQAAIEGG